MLLCHPLRFEPCLCHDHLSAPILLRPGGFFDGKTSAEERREYLLKLLADTDADTQPLAAGQGQAAGAAAGPSGSNRAAVAPGHLSDAELSRLVARGEEELAALAAEDQRRHRLAAEAAGGKDAGKGTSGKPGTWHSTMCTVYMPSFW